MNTLVLDVSRGVTLDALLAALVDAGVDTDRLVEDLASVVGPVSIRLEPYPALGLNIVCEAHLARPDIPDIVRAIRRSPWQGSLRAHAARLLMGLHAPVFGPGRPVVQALAILLAIGQLGVTRLVLTSLAVDPLAVPAWGARWLQGWDVLPVSGAIVDPAALWVLRSMGARTGDFPTMRILASGSGLFGPVDGVRAWLGSEVAAHPRGPVAVLETALPPGWGGDLARVRKACLAAGAEEVFVHPPAPRGGIRMALRCDPAHEQGLRDCLIEDIGVMGVRTTWVQRDAVEAERLSVPTPGGSVRLAVHREGGTAVRLVPELCDALEVARETGHSVQTILRLAVDAALHRAALVG
ncbi:MAG: nickel insertion protein [bacterium]|nr:nickel insertion protein [bacterium]